MWYNTNMITIPPTLKFKCDEQITWYSYTAKGLHIICEKPQKKINGKIVRGKKYIYISTIKLFHWPVRITIELGGQELLCVLAGGQWVFNSHKILLWYKNKIIARWRLPYKWYCWEVLIHSKKLFWYGSKMHN